MRHLRFAFGILITSAIALYAAGEAGRSTPNYYHELTCASVDVTRMTRMSRATAVASGALPAPDCHAGERTRYLGVSGASIPAPNANPAIVHVHGYTRGDGTVVDDYDRSAPAPHLDHH